MMTKWVMGTALRSSSTAGMALSSNPSKKTAIWGERVRAWATMVSMWVIAFGKWSLVEGPGSERREKGWRQGENESG
jgi:hypothetical protein